MRFVVIGDIHSNKFALQNVLEDINSRKVDFIVSTGDLVGYMPFPNEVVDMIRENRILVVQGNHDKFIAESELVEDEEINKMTEEQIQSNASAAFTNWTITDENRKFLKNLPQQLRLSCCGLNILVVHGSPKAIDEYLYEDKEKLTQLSKTVTEDIIICGHTHIPYHLRIDNKHFINAGSVGKPKHGDPQAAYVIIEIENENIKSEIIKVCYDIDSMINSIEGNRMISSKLIPMLRQGN